DSSAYQSMQESPARIQVQQMWTWKRPSVGEREEMQKRTMCT
ncbi:unnamed protein product, partial [marine sediment metagenome]